MKNKSGITLIALVITIIILLILAGVAITTLTQTGLFAKTKQAKNLMENSQILENTTISQYSNTINATIGGSRDIITISKDEYNTLQNLNKYSEEEKIIGTWTNGKKIYRKNITINVKNSSNYTFDAKKILDSNIDSILKTYGYSLVDNGLTYANFPCYYTNEAYLGSWCTTSDKTVHIVSGSQYTTATHYLTFEYTKSTD